MSRGLVGALLLSAVGSYAAAQTAGGSSGAPAGSAGCPSDSRAPDETCTVDLPVYIGWRVYSAHCASCHGDDALGSTFAPDLTLRMRSMDRRAFFAALDNGYLGPDDPTPPRGADDDVARYYEELWAYLAARADGRLRCGVLEPPARAE